MTGRSNARPSHALLREQCGDSGLFVAPFSIPLYTRSVKDSHSKRVFEGAKLLWTLRFETVKSRAPEKKLLLGARGVGTGDGLSVSM
jgi:hypothetical protein